MPSSGNPSAGKASIDGDENENPSAISLSSLDRWRSRQGGSPAAGTAASASHVSATDQAPPTTADDSFEFSNRPSAASGAIPVVGQSPGHQLRTDYPPRAPREERQPTGAGRGRREEDKLTEESKGGDQRAPKTTASLTADAFSRSSALQSRRPPVDAAILSAEWEDRYWAEKSTPMPPHAANASSSRAATTPPGTDDATVTADLQEAYRAKEREARELRVALLQADGHFKRQLDAARSALDEERSARMRAEQDLGELMLSAQGQAGGGVSPSVTLGSANPGTGATGHPSVSTATSNDAASSQRMCTVSGLAASAASDAFWQKMKEREEKARARVRREFIQQSQQKLYAEQDRRAEAEKLAGEAERRMRVAEERAAAQAEAVRAAGKTIDDMRSANSEREVRVSELESEVGLLRRQLALSRADRDKEIERLSQRCEELQAAAQGKDDALEEQRAFTNGLLKELGLKEKDLLDRSSMYDGVMREIRDMQAKYQAQQEAIEAECKNREAALKQEMEHQSATLASLKARCEDLRSRATQAESDMATYKSRHTVDASEAESQRQRLQGQLVELGVEKRSLELQLERVTEAARRYAKDLAACKEGERQSRESLVRHYAAELSALQEEVDRVRVQRSRDQERHLQETLQLGQELAQLKEANTRYEHTLNVLEHNRDELNRLRDRVREDTAYQQRLLVEDRASRRGLGGDHERGPRYSVGPGGAAPSASPATQEEDSRVAELVATQKELRESLAHATARVRLLEQQQQQPQHPSRSSADMWRPSRTASADRARHRRELELEVNRPQTRRDSLVQLTTIPPPLSDAPTAASPSAPPGGTDSIYAALTRVVRLIEGNGAIQRHHRSHRGGPDDQQSGESNNHCANSSASGGGGAGFQGVRDSAERAHGPDECYFKPLERDVLEQVLSSCLAALDCLQGNRSGSPYFSEGDLSFSRSAQRQQDPKRPRSGSDRHATGGGSGALLDWALTRAPAAAGRASMSRTELESEPCWDNDDDREENHHEAGSGGFDASSASDSAVNDNLYVSNQQVPVRGDGILRYSPIPSSVPTSSVPSPAVHRAHEAPSDLFQNVHLLSSGGRPSSSGIISGSRQDHWNPMESSPVSHMSHPHRSTPPPPPQHLRRLPV